MADASECADEVWSIVFEELERVCKEPGGFAPRAPGEDVEMEDEPTEVSEEADMEVDGEVVVVEKWEEEERTWRCPRAITFVQTAAKWRKDKVAVSEVSYPRVRICTLR